ncbi:UNVERIFIED_CONTAM: hypothetical protein GTU68_064770 [Idotea baltica]|nr:hypothetical protein [Idotea baltica]
MQFRKQIDLYWNVVLPNRKEKLWEVFDHLSNSLCKVADLAEFIRMAHPSTHYSSAAENACISIGGLVEKLNTNKALYDSLKEVTIHGDKFPTTEVDDHVAKLFSFDFEQSGIHLSDDKRVQVADLNEKILTLGQQFLSGTLEPRAIPKDKLPEGIRHHFAIDGNNVVVGGMFSDSSVEMTREAAYKIFLHPEQRQEWRLSQLLQARHQMASLCGFPSFAHRAMSGSLAETPELVGQFLTRLSEDLKMEAQNEFDEMNQLKSQIHKGARGLAPWDVAYLIARARHRSLPAELSDGLSAYFSLGAVMDGLSNLFTDLFNISLRVEEPQPGELWTDDVYKVAVVHDSSEVLGHIYCDFFEHHRKAHQDCHFTIRGGKRLEDGEYQNPVVVLHLNLPNPTWSTPCLLSLSMMENLFHEMGHAMHSMLAR